MPSRLTQIAIPGRAYKQPVDVDLQHKSWGWTAYPVTVAYEKPPSSRLGQFAVPAVAYSQEDPAIIGLSSENWGWTAYPVTVEYQDPQNVDLTSTNWGWRAHNPTICSQDNRGWYGSFNQHVWPSCVFNDYVFGPRTHQLYEVGDKAWGWAAYPITVEVLDPVDVALTSASWGWSVYPMGVSYGSEIGFTASAWGWTGQPVAVELPYDVDLPQTDWGWRAQPIGVTYGSDIGLTFATWGWTAYPATVDAPTFDIQLRKADWGWQAFPMEVRQTSLLPGDIEAIADAIWARMQTEGAVQQWLETWQDHGKDRDNPRTIRHPDNGGAIEVGGVVVEQVETPEGDVVQTRQ